MLLYVRLLDSEERPQLKVSLFEFPSSLDPLQYDYSKHHSIQSIFHIKLVSPYKEHKISPQLAESWSHSDAGKRWEFKLRKDISFSSGAVVRPVDVHYSFLRILYKLKKQNSKHEILNRIVGIERLNAASSAIDGIQYDQDKITFYFKSSYPKFLEAVSFGLFAIVNRQDFNEETGDWLSNSFFENIGAGPYEFSKKTKDALFFSKRKLYPKDLFHENSFNDIEFVIGKNRLVEADLASLSSDNQALATTHKFFGRRAMHILYFLCHGWKLENSPLKLIENRKKIREALTNELSEKNISAKNSFLPLVMPHIEGIENAALDGKSTLSSILLRIYDLRPSGSNLVNGAFDSLEGAATRLGMRLEKYGPFSNEFVKATLDPNLNSYPFDLGLYATGISMEDPDADIRLMFSKEGVWLPDLDGKISKKIVKSQVDYQAVNELIYSQALVWPVAHYSIGTWISEKVALDSYNTLLPLGELQWIGSK